MMLGNVGQAQPQISVQEILQTLFSFAFIVYLVFAQRIQAMTMLREVEVTLRKIKSLRDEGIEASVNALRQVGKPDRDPTPSVIRLLEHFVVEPVSMDPKGVVEKLGKILDVSEHVMKREVEALAPNASEPERQNLENLLGASSALNSLYKVTRHYYLLGKKTMNIYTIMQVQMILPQIQELGDAYGSALYAFQNGMPVGDGVGAIVAGKLIAGAPTREVAKDMVTAEVMYEGRRVIVTKAKGPGGTVGDPGVAIARLLEENEGRVKMLITVDAAGMLEGEEVGDVAEGVGAAIGGTGVEKYGIEEAATGYNVPMYAVAIKQGMEHVVAPLVRPLSDATDKALASVKGLILDYSEEGDTVLVAGIGNTMGVGQ